MTFYIYVLQSEKDGNFYIGYTSDLKKRINKHDSGKVRSTSYRRPLYLVYFEGCINQQDALHREKYLKTAWGKRYIKSRIKNYLTGLAPLDKMNKKRVESYLTGLAEATTSEFSKKENPETFSHSKIIAKKGGGVAGNTRKDIEKKLGEKIVTSKNADKIMIDKGDELEVGK